MSETSSPTEQPVPTKKLRRNLTIISIVVVLMIAAMPSFIARSQLRDWLINQLQNDPYLKITSGNATFGWLSPTSIADILVTSDDQRVNIRVNRLSSRSALPKLWFDAPDIGTVDIEGTQIHIKLPLAESEVSQMDEGLFYRANLKRTHILIEVDGDSEPIVDLKDLNLVANIERDETGAWMRMEEFTLFERRDVTEELCDEFMQLIDPVLADVARVSGHASCQIHEFEIPLNAASDDQAIRDLKIKGTLTLHDLSGEFKTPLLDGIMRILADLYEVEVPETMRLVKETQIHFEVRAGRIYHEGLVFGLPDISPDLIIQSQGSVGIDESLDLTIQVPPILVDNKNTSSLTRSKPVILRVLGTIANPEVTEFDKIPNGNEEETNAK